MTKDQIAQFKAQVALNADAQVADQERYGKAILWDQMTNAEIAKIMGVTKRQVSKMRRSR